MKSENVTNILIYTAVIFFPFQFLAIRFFSSAYDITSLLIIMAVFVLMLSKIKINYEIIIWISIFVIMESVIVIYFNIGPYYRFLSGVVWLTSLLAIILYGDKDYDYSQKVISYLILFLLFFSSIYMFYEYYFIITPEIYSQFIEGRPTKFYLLRPKAGFQEPSYAALALFSSASAIVSTLILSRLSHRNIVYLLILLIIFSGAAFLARSMHIATFIITVSIVISIWLTYKLSIFKIFIFLGILFLILLLGIFLLSFPHYYDRINIFVDPLAMTNPSLLSWLRGFDQVLAVMNSSPLTGFGIGSTGYFEFESLYGERLAYYRIYDLTLKDAFSLLWRLLIEIGIIPVILFSIFMIYKLSHFRKYLINKSDLSINNKYIIFNFTFALALIIGCLIKEPNYARSTLFIGIFLIASIPLNKKTNDN